MKDRIRTPVGLAALGAIVLSGTTCQAILGGFDYDGRGTGGGGATSATSASSTSTSTTSATSSSGGGASSSATTSSGGTGGSTAQPSFTFAITDTSANVPQGGLAFVNVAVTPSGGFDAAVDVTLKGAPSGVTAMPLTIPAGSTTGKLEVGADMTEMLGAMFTLTVQATSGAIVQTATVPAVVTGAPGTLDTSFAAGGIYVGPKGTGNGGGALLSFVRETAQGKILASGSTSNSLGTGSAFGLRLLQAGTADTNFNTTGVVTHTFCSCSSGFGNAAAELREMDGTLLLMGSGHTGTSLDIVLFRYNDNGTVDGAQGDTSSGVEDVPLGANTNVNAAELAPNSSEVVIAGDRSGGLVVSKIAETEAQGFPDQSFAAPNGWIAPAVGGTSSSAGAITFDATGNVLVAGWTVSASMDADVVLLRLTPAGALDTSFGGTGIVKLPRSGNQHGSAIVVQPDGNILVAADTDEGGVNQLLLQRFLPSGVPDTTFGNQGVTLAPVGGTASAFSGGPSAWMVLMTDGRVVAAGNPWPNQPSSQPVLARFLRDGSPDPTFGTAGTMSLYVGDYGTISAMAMTSAGMLLIGGSIGSGPNGTYVARLWN